MPFCGWWMCASASHIFPTQEAFSAYGQASAADARGSISVDRGLVV
jgi:hypothetical protein